MDNKKWYKRISTCFWFLFAIMPLIISFFGFIGTFFIHTDSLTTSSDILNIYNNYTFDYYLVKYCNYFANLTPNFITNMFGDLLRSFNITSTYRDVLRVVLGWFCWVYILEVMIDVFVWLPKFFHNLLDKGVGKID